MDAYFGVGVSELDGDVTDEFVFETYRLDSGYCFHYC